MGFRFEFDHANRILLLRVEGQLSDELLAECYEAIRKHSVSTDARMGIFDLSSVSQFAVSSEFVRQLQSVNLQCRTPPDGFALSLSRTRQDSV